MKKTAEQILNFGKKKNGKIRKGNETSSRRIILHPHHGFTRNKKGPFCSGFEGGFIVRDPWYDDNESEASKAKRVKQRKMLNGVEQRNGLGEAWNILNNEDQATVGRERERERESKRVEVTSLAEWQCPFHFDLKFAWLIKRRIHLAKNTQIETSHLNGNRETKPEASMPLSRGRAKGGSILHKWTDGNSISQRLVFRLVASGVCLGIVKRGSWHFSLFSLHFEDRGEILENVESLRSFFESYVYVYTVVYLK